MRFFSRAKDILFQLVGKEVGYGSPVGVWKVTEPSISFKVGVISHRPLCGGILKNAMPALLQVWEWPIGTGIYVSARIPVSCDTLIGCMTCSTAAVIGSVSAASSTSV